jgi:hypothetical protein
MTGGVASGAPQPTVTQIQQKLNKLNTQADKLDDQFNQVQQELTSANQRLALVNKQAARYLVTFDAMRTQVAQIAAQQFENSALTTPEALLTSGDPQEILNQSSILLELSSSNRSAMRQYFAAAREPGAQQSAPGQGRDRLLKTKLASKKTTLKRRRAAVAARPVPGAEHRPRRGWRPSASSRDRPTRRPRKPSHLRTTRLAAHMCSVAPVPAAAATTARSDHAGLGRQGVDRAHQRGSVASLPHVSTSALEPGDILVFSGASHVGIYVGNNMLIDAPHTGLDVEKVALTGWYLSNLDGAVRP